MTQPIKHRRWTGTRWRDARPDEKQTDTAPLLDMEREVLTANPHETRKVKSWESSFTHNESEEGEAYGEGN